MKRPVIYVVSALLAATAVCSFAGCGSSDKASSATGGSSAASQASAQSSAAASSAADDTAAVISAQDVVFSYNGVSVELNSDADAAVAALGDPVNVSSQLSCHGTGDDKTYTYDGFILNTYPLDGQDRVLEIVINSETIATSKGVKIGDPVSAVTAAYGDNFKKSGFYYAYSAGDGKSLQFFIEDDTVKEINYYYDVK